ncbi:MAG: SRPBCC family protein [Actinomycetota bacterium]
MTDGSVELETRVDAPRDLVFEFLVDPALYVRWQGSEADLDPRPGGRFRVVIEGNVMLGEYVEVQRPNRVVVTWGWEGNPKMPPGSSTVEFTLEADGEGTLVRVRHTGLPESERGMHRQGWERYLATLSRQRPQTEGSTG